MADEPAPATESSPPESDDGGAADLVNTIARGASFGAVGRLGSKVLAVGLQILLTRTLGSSGYGLYVLGKSVVDTGQGFASLGLRQGAIRYGAMYAAEDDDRLSTVLVASFALSLVSAVLMAGAVFAFAEPLATRVFDDPEMAFALRLFAVGVPFYVVTGLTAAYFQAFERIDREQLLTNGVRPVANILLVVVAFGLGFRLGGAIVAFVLAGVASSIVGLYLLVRVHGVPLSVSVSPDRRAVIRRLVVFSLSMMLITMSTELARRTDRLMLGILDATETVGIYNVAAMISLQFSIVLSSLIAIFKPMVADLSVDTDVDRMADLYGTVTKWSSYGTLALFVVVATYPEHILSVFGGEFTRGQSVLYVLPLMYVAGALFGPCGALLTMTGRQKVELVNGAFLVILNVVLNLLLIPIYGALGAAIAVVLAATATNVLQVSVVYLVYGFHPFDRAHLGVVAVAVAVVAASVALGARLGLLGRTLAAAALLIGLGLLFYRALDETERGLLTRALGRG